MTPWFASLNVRTCGFLALGFTVVVGVILGVCTVSKTHAGEPRSIPADTVRDRLWIFTCVAGSDNDSLERAGFPRRSRMTPAEGAFYLGVPNLMLIRWRGKPAPPFDQYAVPFRPLKRVVWSLVDSGGETSGEGRKAALDLAKKCPNLTGFIMDDFFNPSENNAPARMSLEQLRDLRAKLVIDGKKRDLYVVIYQHQLELPVKAYLKLCDKITYWVWHADDLKNLQRGFSNLEKLAPDRGILLGCYFWDFGGQRPMPLELMKMQCETGLRWLHEGRIEGIIFLANTVADLDLPAVEWTRKWITGVGDQRIGHEQAQP